MTQTLNVSVDSQKVTFLDIVAALNHFRNELLEASQSQATAKVYYDEIASVIKMQIWSNKQWLQMVDFAQHLNMVEIPVLSNDTLRESAFNLAKDHDSLLRDATATLQYANAELSRLKIVVENLQSIERLFIGGHLNHISIDLLDTYTRIFLGHK